MDVSSVVISAAVEGGVDQAVVRRLIAEVSAIPGSVHVAHGKNQLRKNTRGYNHAAARIPWMILVDLDHEESCAAKLRDNWLPSPAKLMCFRVAVREVEAWLLADRDRIAQFLAVPVIRIPRNPDEVDDPKRAIVNLAARSRRRDIREDLVPRTGGGRSEGPAYTSRLIEFSASLWRPSLAEKCSDSLRRCLRRLRALVSESQV
jgi:hypothetical protein